MNHKNITPAQTANLNPSPELQLVLLHGWGMNQGIWSEFKTQLSSWCNLPVVCIDLPGFGMQKDVLLQPYTIKTLAENIYAQLPPNSVLIGWSLGGLVAQQIANVGGEKLLAHIQIGSSPKFSQVPDWPGIKPEMLTLFSKQLQHDHEVLLKRFLAIQCMGLPNAKAMLKDMLDKIKAFPLSTNQALRDSLLVLQETDLRLNMLYLNAVPCLRIFGGLDSLVPVDVIPKIQALCPQSRSVVIDKAAHAPFISHPELTLQAIGEFVDTLELSLARTAVRTVQPANCG